LKTALRATCIVTFIVLAWTIHQDSTVRGVPAPLPVGNPAAVPPQVAPLWFQADGRDNPASVENDTPFPNSHLIASAQWTTPRYYPNPKVQHADILPVTWADDGNSYFLGDDGSVHDTVGTTVIARILGVPPDDNSVPKMDFELLAHDTFLYGCPKSVTEKSCYSVGFTEVANVFYAPTYDGGYPVVGNHYRGHARIDYSPLPVSQTSWVHGTVDFPEPVGSGVVSFVEVGQGAPAQDGCSGTPFPHGCIYSIVSEGGYQDPKDPNGIDQFIATELYLARMAVGTRERQYQEVANPLNWQWFAGFDRADHPTWVPGNDKQLARHIRSLSFPRHGRSGCGVDTIPCLFWDQPAGRAGHVNYPHMAYDRALDRYFLTLADYYYRDFQPPSESGPMVQGGAELIVLEAPHPWGPWSFVLRSPYVGSGNAYGPSFPVQWEGPRTPTGQDLWMIWAANFSGCGKPMLVPADLCQGVYGMNLRRLHLTLAGTAGAIRRPWFDQDVGFASPGRAKFEAGRFEIIGNGNLALRPDPFGQYKDHLDHDAFHFVFQRVEGNCELEAQLGPLRAGTEEPQGQRARPALPGPEASAGLMLRESNYVFGQTAGQLRGRQLSPGDTFNETARYGYVEVFKDGNVVFQWRDDGHVSRGRTQSQACPAGCLLKIVRHDNQVSAFLSVSHGPWREVGSHTFSPPLSRAVTAGMLATSDSPSTFPQYATFSGRFDHVTRSCP
jgi:hypothetical protein